MFDTCVEIQSVFLPIALNIINGSSFGLEPGLTVYCALPWVHKTSKLGPASLVNFWEPERANGKDKIAKVSH